MSGTFFLVTFPSEPYHYNWVCFNILNSEWVQLLAYRRCLINICGIRAGYDSDLSPALRPPPVRAGCISGYDSDPSPPSPPPVQVGCITGSGLNSPISSQHPTVRHRKTFMKSPCDHGISLHSSLCYLSNSLWIKKKKKKGEQDPGHYLRGIHSTAYCVPGSWDPTGPCSGHPEPWACLLVMPGGLLCAPTLKAVSHPVWSSQSWRISAPVRPELTEDHQARLWPLQGCDQPHQPGTFGSACLGHSCCHPGNKRYIGWGSAHRAAQDLHDLPPTPFSP